MKLRTTVFLWVLVLVALVLATTIATIAVVFDRSARARLADELVRSREVTLALHASRQDLYLQSCRVVAEEPRLRAVVATEDVARETVVDGVQALAATLEPGVFVVVDAVGRLIADHSAPDDEGFDLSGLPVVARGLVGQAAGVWIRDDHAYQVAGCRLAFGARVVGALVLGHAIDDRFAETIARQTGGAMILAIDGAPVTRLPEGVAAAELRPAVAAVRAGAKEVTLGGVHWFAQLVPVPGYEGEHRVDYLLLRSIDEALAPAREAVRALLYLAGGAALATLLLALALARRLGRPIDALVARTRAIAGGDLAPRPIAGPTEVRALGAAMDRMVVELDGSRRALLEKDRLAREMEIAARIQTSILPRAPAAAGLEIAAQMRTASEVGGDYYDVLRLDDADGADGGCWIAIGDASGHGLTAGLVMMMVQTGVAALVRAQPDARPRDLLDALNRVVYENVHDRLEAERHMTLSLLRYRPDAGGGGTFVVAGAHMDAVAWRAATRSVELLRTPGTFLAITDDISAVNTEVTWRLAPGDVLVLLTDGVTEAEDAAGRAFGYDGVTAVVEARAGEPVRAIQDAVFEALAAHSPALADDATILILRHVDGGRPA